MWLQEFQFISRINFPEVVTNLIRNSWNGCKKASSRFTCTSFITSKMIMNMNVLCISQFQERTSPPPPLHATPGLLHPFSARVLGICTVRITRGLPRGRTYYQSTKLSVDAACRHFSARKILKAKKFHVKMLLHLLISQLQIPDLISVPFHNS